MPEGKQLIIQSKVDPGKIITNFPELKEEIKKQVEPYIGLDLETIELKDKKDMLARLRKGKQAVDQRRKDVKKEYLVPLNHFEDLCKELTGEFDQAITEIDESVKAHIEAEKQEKRAQIEKHIDDILSASKIADYIKPLPFFFDEKWLNTTVKMPKIQEEIAEKVRKIESDVQILSGEKYYDRLIAEYGKNGDLSACLSMRDRLAEQDKQAQEMKERIEAEKQSAKAQEKPQEQKAPEQPEPQSEQETKQPAQGAEESQQSTARVIEVRFIAKGATDAMIRLGEFCRENGIELRRV